MPVFLGVEFGRYSWSPTGFGSRYPQKKIPKTPPIIGNLTFLRFYTFRANLDMVTTSDDYIKDLAAIVDFVPLEFRSRCRYRMTVLTVQHASK